MRGPACSCSREPEPPVHCTPSAPSHPTWTWLRQWLRCFQVNNFNCFSRKRREMGSACLPWRREPRPGMGSSWVHATLCHPRPTSHLPSTGACASPMQKAMPPECPMGIVPLIKGGMGGGGLQSKLSEQLSPAGGRCLPAAGRLCRPGTLQ